MQHSAILSEKNCDFTHDVECELDNHAFIDSLPKISNFDWKGDYITKGQSRCFVFGKMERDELISHAVANFIKDCVVDCKTNNEEQCS